MVFAFLLTLGISRALAQGGESHKIQVSDPALAQEIEGAGGRLIADYGGYRLYETPQAPSRWLANPRAELRDGYNVILLHAGHLDTRKAEVRALRNFEGAFEGKRLHLVQFAGPVQSAWRAELLAAGVKIVTHIPENTYLVYGDAAALARVQGLAAGSAQHIQWDGAYRDEYKIQPAARAVDAQGKPRNIGTDIFDIQLVADDAANSNTLALLDQLKLEPVRERSRVLDYVNVTVRLEARNLARVAAQPDVVAILPYFPRRKLCERQDEIVSGNLVDSAPAGPGYLAWLESVGFSAGQFTNFLVDVTDSGIDDGTTAPNHFGLYAGGSLSNASRVVYNRLEGTPNSGSTLAGCDGHGNLNAHIVAGYDDFGGFPFADGSGFHYGLGVCPFVSVGSSVIFDPTDFTSPNLNDAQSEAYHSGARVSNNSWGEQKSEGAYDSVAQNMDALVRDAQPANSTYPTAGNQGMVIVFAAGNEGPGAQTMDSPGTAKNIICVGAGENVQAFGGADGSGITDDEANSADDVIFFSSRGPCADGRNKPDLMAPGTHVSGGVYQATNDFTDYPDGIAAGCFNGDAISGGPGGSLYWPLGQEFYTASSGTSHSTPCVTGGCALVLQYFLNHFTNLPSPAMTKAYLMNSARYMTGAYADDTLPSGSQGMGEMNLGTAFDGVPRILRDQAANDMFTNSGQTRTFFGTIPSTNNGFRVTLAWTDAPGSLSGNAYNNDLDLTVTVGGNTYKGNVFSGAYSTTGGAADAANNVESVFLPAGVSGNFMVTVTAASINSIGVPNSSNALSQDFALVVYNGTLFLTPDLNPAGTTLTAEGCSPSNGVIDPGETVTVNFGLQNTGLGNTTNLVATLLPGPGVFSPSGPQSYGVLTVGGAAVSRAFTFTAGGTCGGTIAATFQLQDGSFDLGTVDFTMQLGKLVSGTTFAQNFDGVAAPALPSLWTTTVSGAGTAWVSSTAAHDTAPNAAFVADVAGVGLSELVSPVIPIVSATAQLSFRNDYNLEASSHGTNGFDGGVLEIQISGGGFTDIETAGGSFVTGGYTRTLSSSFGNPLGGRRAWSGNSGGFITTTVNLPAAAAGQNVQLKWRCGTDDSVGEPGWFIDSISLTDSSYACCNDTADVAVFQTASPNPAVAGANLNFNLTVTNFGPVAAANVVVTDTVPVGPALVSASPGAVTNGGALVWNLGSLASGAGTNLNFTVLPGAEGEITNLVTVGSDTFDLDLDNNTNALVLGVYVPVTIISSPTNETVMAGADASFQVSATGSALAYQWAFNATNILDATNDILTLTDVQPDEAGDYTVKVSNPVGSAGRVAELNVILPPLTIQVTGGTVSISLVSEMGVNYTLQYKNNLTVPNWISIAPTVPGTGGVITLQDPSPSLTGRFYRVTGE